jgi:hypothetical protein
MPIECGCYALLVKSQAGTIILAPEIETNVAGSDHRGRKDSGAGAEQRNCSRRDLLLVIINALAPGNSME